MLCSLTVSPPGGRRGGGKGCLDVQCVDTTEAVYELCMHTSVEKCMKYMYYVDIHTV